MNRIATLFKKKKPYIAYLVAGDGGIEFSIASFLALVEGGVDLLEIGIPFSDPVADGPVIQKAMTRTKITLKDVLKIIAAIREKSSVPIVLFSYYNPILQAGDSFLQKAKEAGADGLLVDDVPLEESVSLQKKCHNIGLDLIYLVAPSTPIPRVQLIEKRGSGFLYYAAQKGTTGMRSTLPEDLHTKLQEIKKHSTLPIACGFGISTVAMAKEVLQSADGFVVGSYFVKAIEEGKKPSDLITLAKILDPRNSI